MALKIRLEWPKGWKAWAAALLLVALGLLIVTSLVGFSVFGYYYFKYRSIVDARLNQPMFANTAKIFAAPREVRPGQKLTVRVIAKELHDAGYTLDGAAQPSQLGTYSESLQSITVNPVLPRAGWGDDPHRFGGGAIDYRRPRPGTGEL